MDMNKLRIWVDSDNFDFNTMAEKTIDGTTKLIGLRVRYRDTEADLIKYPSMDNIEFTINLTKVEARDLIGCLQDALDAREDLEKERRQKRVDAFYGRLDKEGYIKEI